jgi:hypothetical protein
MELNIDEVVVVVLVVGPVLHVRHLSAVCYVDAHYFQYQRQHYVGYLRQ